MAREKIDWTEHQKQFEKQKKASPNLTVQEYCDANNLSFSSAKRHIKSRAVKVKPAPKKRGRKANHDYASLYDRYIHLKMHDPSLTISDFARQAGAPVRNTHVAFKKLESEIGSKSAKLRDPISQKDQQKEVRNSQKTSQKKPSNNNDIAEQKQRGRKARKLLTELTKKTDKGAGIGAISQASGDAISQLPERDGYGRLLPGNTAGKIHGGYMKLAQLDSQLVEAVSSTALTDITNELIAAKTQLLSMHQTLGRNLANLELDYVEGRVKKDEGGNVVPIDQERARLVFGTSDRFRSLELSIANLTSTAAKIQHDSIKLQQKAWELPARSAAEIAEITAILMATRHEEEWTATKTAQQFESYGIKVPPFLLIEARKEIDDFEPEVDDSGMSDDELEQISREYMAKQANTEQWRNERRDSVNQAIAEAEERERTGVVSAADKDEPEDEPQITEQTDLDAIFDGLDGFEEIDPEGAV